MPCGNCGNSSIVSREYDVLFLFIGYPKFPIPVFLGKGLRGSSEKAVSAQENDIL